MKYTHAASIALVAVTSFLGGCASSPGYRQSSAPASAYGYGGVTATSTPSGGGSSSGYAPAPPPAGVSASVEASVSDVAPAAPRAQVTPPMTQYNGGETGPAPAPEPHPTVRPGLATEYGESRQSAMTYAPFVRGASQPYDTAMIHYNDAQGAAAQAAYHAANNPVYYAVAYNNGVRISLRDEAGNPLPGYHAGDRLYIVGQAGRRYTILIENQSPARFEAVVSVDGLDVINGQTASFASRGYILPAHGRLTIEGFRQSTDTVAAFRFGSVADSYAAQTTGSARNVGVIGVALFAERGAVLQPLGVNEVEMRENANPFPGQFAPPPPRRNYQ